MKKQLLFFCAVLSVGMFGCARQGPQLTVDTAPKEANVVEEIAPDTKLITATAIQDDDKPETIEEGEAGKDKTGAVALKQEF